MKKKKKTLWKEIIHIAYYHVTIYIVLGQEWTYYIMHEQKAENEALWSVC